MLQIYTGNGKGKTTAALGLALRARGAGLKTAIIFFNKGGNFYSERRILKKIGVNWQAFGRKRFIEGHNTKGHERVTNKTRKAGWFIFGVTDKDKEEGRKAIKAANNLLKKSFDVIILDEICSAVGLGIVDLADTLRLIKKRPKNTELVLTGRNCPKALIKLADLVSEAKEIKHYFKKGVKARRGIDY